jgi:hypothetical protein
MARKTSGKRGGAIIALIAVLAALAAAAPASADTGEFLYDQPELIASWAEEGVPVELAFDAPELVASWAEE